MPADMPDDKPEKMKKPENLPARVIRIKAVARKVLAGKGRKSVGAAMREEGYSPVYADTPQKLTRSKTWKQILAEFLPDELIAQKHLELANAAEIQHYTFPHKSERKTKKDVMSDEEIQAVVESVPGCKLIYIKADQYLGKVAYFQAPDHRSRKDAIDMAWKLRGRYAAEKLEIDDPFERMTNGELADKIARLKAHLLKKRVKK